ncbi:hypothetical protein [Inhella proteolytica]|uniref:hypothetical protein n=1 Tax=Inhella proteolytica TaxID=2795029 RepID=UPI0018DC27B4|nr:hypothetical protein [Inhella proteolytica]
MLVIDAGNAAGENSPYAKVARILYLFAVKGVSLNRFEGERHHDHCLHSTVSTLQNQHGILIDRVTETVPCLGGRKQTRCRRYWLRPSPENVGKALALLRAWRVIK